MENGNNNNATVITRTDHAHNKPITNSQEFAFSFPFSVISRHTETRNRAKGELTSQFSQRPYLELCVVFWYRHSRSVTTVKVSREATVGTKNAVHSSLEFSMFIYILFLVFYFDACLLGAKFPVKLAQIPVINKYERHRETTGYFCKLLQNRVFIVEQHRYRSVDFVAHKIGTM